MIYTKAEAQAKYPHITFYGGVFNIGDNVIIGRNTTIGDNVTIGGGVRIGDNVTIWDNVNIWADVTLRNNVTIKPHITIRNNVTIEAYTTIQPYVDILDKSTIAEDVLIPTGSEVPRSRTNINRALAINGIGGHKQITAVDCDDGLIIGIGCMNNYEGLPIEEAREEIAKKYPDENHLYYSALRWAQEWYGAESEGAR